VAALALRGTNNNWALILFCVAATTDYFDGLVARKFDQITVSGARLDASVDKLFIYVLVAVLYMRGVYVLPVVLIALSRDFIVEILRHKSAAAHSVIPANRWGKMKFIIQCASIAAALAGGNALSFSYVVANCLLVLATIASLPGFLLVWKAAQSPPAA
jgi:CDP-diacylglycerol--glycerol-3-phosphate 3-phosphatidyltransferase